jgi:hypothetical protein
VKHELERWGNSYKKLIGKLEGKRTTATAEGITFYSL